MAKVLSRGERIRQFGIDCGDGLTWPGGTWSPGGEYCKKLVVKNVGLDTVRLNYKLPATKFFFLDFPEVIKLTPGTHVSINVVFRPIRFEEYDDTIEFFTKTNSFAVPVRAKLSKLSVNLRESLDFGFCATSEAHRMDFTIDNTGEIPAAFRWDVPAPFSLSPAEGTIAPKQSFTITASFSPTDASAFVSRAVCAVQGLPGMAMKISGVGKYPFLSASEPNIHFGDVLAGADGTAEKEFIIRNHSVVRVSFRVERVEKDRDSVFEFSPRGGSVDGGCSQSVRVRLTGGLAGSFASDTFNIVTPGGNTVQVRATGNIIGPSVALAKKVPPRKPGMPPPSRSNAVVFGDVQVPSPGRHAAMEKVVPKAAVRVIYLTNASNVPAYFAFQCEDNGTFTFDQIEGVIPPMLEVPITIRFAPTMPGNYYRRIFCLIEHQQPLFVDLIGTGWASGNRPQPLLLKHVDAHLARETAGAAAMSPDELMALAARGDDPAQNPAVMARVQGDGVHAVSALTRSGEATQRQTAVHDLFFRDFSDHAREITVEERELNFGAGSRMRTGDKKALHVTNHTHAKVVFQWCAPDSGGDPNCAFGVHPTSADIGPGRTAEFSVSFRPARDNFYYCQELEAYCYFKTNRSFRLVNDEAFTPPWAATVRVLGHTFSPLAEQWIPKVVVTAAQKPVTFPACHLGDSVYQTIRLRNNGDTPATFRFSEDGSGTFMARPDSGLIGMNRFVLVSLRFTPQRARLYRRKLRCILNNSSENTVDLILTGAGCQPEVEFVEGDSLYFQPTCVGLTSSRVFTVRNSSRVPLTFQWKIPEELRNVLQVRPSVGKLRGNEEAVVRWIFSPCRQKKYSLRVPCLVRSLGDQRPLAKHSLLLVGEGGEGAVLFEPPCVDFGTVLVATETSKIVQLVNSADCDLRYEIFAGSTEGAGRNTPNGCSGGVHAPLQFSHPAGVLHARSAKKIRLTFQPPVRGSFSFRVFCQFTAAPESGAGARDTAPPSLAVDPVVCDVVGSGAYPTLAIEDIRCHAVSTRRLWSQFSCKQLNDALATPLTEDEVKFSRSTGVVVDPNKPALENPLPLFVLSFTPARFQTKPEVVYAQLRNTSHLPVTFTFKFPDDLDVEVENWADTGEPTEAELRQNAILDAKLFDIQPRHGILGVGEAVTITLSYAHSMLDYGGQHDVEVLLSLCNGKQCRLRICGHTLEPGVPFLGHPRLAVLREQPVAITDPLDEGVEVFNPGPAEIEYVLDEEPLEALTRENFDFEVLKCINPRGTIPAGAFHALKFAFVPLEAKTYHLDLCIRYNGPGTVVADANAVTSLSIEASGFLPKGETKVMKNFVDARFLAPPLSQLLLLPEQIARLNKERLLLGRIPIGSSVTRCVVLLNTSSTPVMFAWDLGHPLLSTHTSDNAPFSIRPSSGKVAPGCCAVVKVTLETQCSVPCVIDDDLICHVRHFVDEEEANFGCRISSRGRRSSVSRASSSRQRVRSERKKQHVSVIGRSTACLDAHRAAATGDRICQVSDTLPVPIGDPGINMPVIDAKVSLNDSARLQLQSAQGSHSGTACSAASTMTASRLTATAQMYNLSRVGAAGVAEKGIMNSCALHLNISAAIVNKGTEGEKRGVYGDHFARRTEHPVGTNPCQKTATSSALTAASVASACVAADILSLVVKNVTGDCGIAQTIADNSSQAPYFLRRGPEFPSIPTPFVLAPSMSRVSEKQEQWNTASGRGTREQILQNCVCQDAVFSVLENTFFNLIREASHDDVVLTKPPQKIVRIAAQEE